MIIPIKLAKLLHEHMWRYIDINHDMEDYISIIDMMIIRTSLKLSILYLRLDIVQILVIFKPGKHWPKIGASLVF